MKELKLMRGDYVMFYDKHKIGHIAKVDQVLRHSCLLLYKKGEEELEIVVNYEDIHPIPLTLEILEKNDYKKWAWFKHRPDDVVTYHVGNGFYVEVNKNGEEFTLVDNCSDDGDYGYTSNWIADIKYVHQLQHLYNELDFEDDIKL